MFIILSKDAVGLSMSQSFSCSVKTYITLMCWTNPRCPLSRKVMWFVTLFVMCSRRCCCRWWRCVPCLSTCLWI
jgi:hypothetical protein